MKCNDAGDQIVYEGPLPLLSGNFRLVSFGKNHYCLHHETLWDGNHHGWERTSLSGQHKHIHQYAYIEALKLALDKAIKIE